MDFKKETQKLLDFLKSKGKDRRTIENDLGLAEKYLDQALAKGSNKKLVDRLQMYKEAILQKEIPETLGKEDRAMLKALVHHYAKRVAKQDGVSLESVLDDIGQDTMLILRDMK